MAFEPYPWFAFAIVLVVPLVATADRGRAYFFEVPWAILTWTIVVGFALGGIVAARRFQADPLHPVNYTAFFFVPLSQALAFATGQAVFALMFGRPPVACDTARLQRNAQGKRWLPDLIFWILLFFGSIILGVCICIAVGIQLPSRHGVS